MNGMDGRRIYFNLPVLITETSVKGGFFFLAWRVNLTGFTNTRANISALKKYFRYRVSVIMNTEYDNF